MGYIVKLVENKKTVVVTSSDYLGSGSYSYSGCRYKSIAREKDAKVYQTEKLAEKGAKAFLEGNYENAMYYHGYKLIKTEE